MCAETPQVQASGFRITEARDLISCRLQIGGEHAQEQRIVVHHRYARGVGAGMRQVNCSGHRATA
jgi:hypothetical protein